MAIQKPSVVTWCLNFVNWDAGEWVHQSISFLGKHIFTLNIPPFSLHIGRWVDWALVFLLDAINAALDAIWEAISKIPNFADAILWVAGQLWEGIRAAKQELVDVIAWAAGNLWEGIRAAKQELSGAIAWVGGQLWEGIAAAKREVLDSIPGVVNPLIAAAFLPFRWHFNLLTEFGQDIIDLFKDPEEWLLDRIERMLVRFL